MNILIACVESQAVCKAFRNKGHNAFSCDIQEFEQDEEIRNAKTECYTDLIDYIAELKKKYTEDGE